MTEALQEIQDRVRSAYGERQALYIIGGGSKRHWLGRDCEAPELRLGSHSGVVDYQPRELVITARAGTPIAEIDELLASEGQRLAFEPPALDGRATLGGTIACNLSGPARPWLGSARDMLLGVNLVDGRGEMLSFGGQVMKNVAGYDISRLQAGALGCLGVLTQLSLKLLPLPEESLTLRYEMDEQDALRWMNQTAAGPAPLSAACWYQGACFLRLQGAHAAVRQSATLLGGEAIAVENAPWSALREFSHPFMQGEAALWRASVAATAAPLGLGDTLIDWCGAQRWLRGDVDRAALRERCTQSGGHASLFRGGDRHADTQQALPEVSRTLHQRLKQTFDPAGVFNPGRLFSWL